MNKRIRHICELIFNGEYRLNEKGLKYLKENKYDKALACYDKMLSIDSKNSEALNSKAGVFFDQGFWNKALGLYDESIRADKDNCRPYYNKGLIYRSRKEYVKALKDFDRVTEINSNHFYAWHNKYSIYLKQKKYDEAAKCLAHALMIRKTSTDDLYNLVCLFSLQDYKSKKKHKKKEILKSLEMLFSVGYFNNIKNVLGLLDEADFDFYKKDKDFKLFIKKVVNK